MISHWRQTSLDFLGLMSTWQQEGKVSVSSVLHIFDILGRDVLLSSYIRTVHVSYFNTHSKIVFVLTALPHRTPPARHTSSQHVTSSPLYLSVWSHLLPLIFLRQAPLQKVECVSLTTRKMLPPTTIVTKRLRTKSSLLYRNLMVHISWR